MSKSHLCHGQRTSARPVPSAGARRGARCRGRRCRSSTAARRGAGSGRRARAARRRPGRGRCGGRRPRPSGRRPRPGASASGMRAPAAAHAATAARGDRRSASRCVRDGVAPFGGEPAERLARLVEVPVGVVAREAQRRPGRRPSIAGASSRSSGGSSSGCVVKRRARRRTRTAAARTTASRCGSAPSGVQPPQQADERDEAALHQHHAVRGKRSKMPWQRIEAKCPCMPEPHEGVVLGVVVGMPGGGHRAAMPTPSKCVWRRPAGRGRRTLARSGRGRGCRTGSAPRPGGRRRRTRRARRAAGSRRRRPRGAGRGRRSGRAAAARARASARAASRCSRGRGGRRGAGSGGRERRRLVRREDPEVTPKGRGRSRAPGRASGRRAARLPRRSAVVGVAAQPARRVVPRVATASRARWCPTAARARRSPVEVRQQVAERVVADVDVAVDQHHATYGRHRSRCELPRAQSLTARSRSCGPWSVRAGRRPPRSWRAPPASAGDRRRLLATLEDAGFVERAAGGWRIGPELMRLARRADPDRALARRRGPSSRARGRAGESAMLGVARAGPAVDVIAQADGPGLLGVTNWVGRPIAVHASAAGKLVLAELDDRALAAWVARVRPAAHARHAHDRATSASSRGSAPRAGRSSTRSPSPGWPRSPSPVRDPDGLLGRDPRLQRTGRAIQPAGSLSAAQTRGRRPPLTAQHAD